MCRTRRIAIDLLVLDCDSPFAATADISLLFRYFQYVGGPSSAIVPLSDGLLNRRVVTGKIRSYIIRNAVVLAINISRLLRARNYLTERSTIYRISVPTNASGHVQHRCSLLLIIIVQTAKN